jgi:hypothetical protein
MMGGWEDVRKKLGATGLGLEMPENPHNSIGFLRRSVGVGIFSERSVFFHDESQGGGKTAYLQQAQEAFSKSSEGQLVSNNIGNLNWHRCLLDFGLVMHIEIVDTMSLETVQDFVLNHVPRVVTIEPEMAVELVWELAMFWQFLNREYKLPQAQEIFDWLTQDGLIGKVEAALGDESHFSIVKSMVMKGIRAGYDMTTTEGVNQFMLARHQSVADGLSDALAGAHTERSVLVSPEGAVKYSKERVGRNDPCPCGSGKKFKKCCL